MKTYFLLAISASIFASHTALAAKCRLITRNSNLNYYQGEMDTAYEALKKLGYAFHEYDKKNENESSLKLHLIIETRDSTLGCERTLQLFSSTPDEKKSELVYEKISTKFGFKSYKVGDPCDKSLEKAVRSVPSCQEMIQKIGKNQAPETGQSGTSSSQSTSASARAAIVGAQ